MTTPARMRCRLAIALVIALSPGLALAQGRPAPVPVPQVPAKKPPPPRTPPTHDMGTLGIAGKDRKALLVYFLERAEQELERASLERRSFVPELIRTVDAESL